MLPDYLPKFSQTKHNPHSPIHTKQTTNGIKAFKQYKNYQIHTMKPKFTMLQHIPIISVHRPKARVSAQTTVKMSKTSSCFAVIAVSNRLRPKFSIRM